MESVVGDRINRLLFEYLRNGGFPEIVLRKENLKRRLLNQYFHDILYKDIVNRHRCHPARVKDLAGYLMTNVSNLTSLRALRGTFGYGLNIIGEYLEYLEDAFLIFQLYLFDYSIKKQLVNPRKIYALESAMQEYDLKESLIITMDRFGIFERKGRTITFVPVYKWLLS